MAVVSEAVRERIAMRAAGFCEHCRYPEEFNAKRFAVDHIRPRVLNGTDSVDNLALVCRSCNEHKQDATEGFDPATGGLAPLFHPRADLWEVHFVWNEDFSLMIGSTATGRATIARLQTNHRGVVRQREVLYQLGLYPPRP